MIFKKGISLSVIALATIGLVLTLTTIAALSANQTIPLAGTVTAVNLGVYSDSACTQPLTSLSSVSVSPGGTSTQTIYIKNIGNVPETLTMTTSNWNPTNANTYLTLTWNRQNRILNADDTTQATLTLTASSNTGSLTSFGCDVTFTGTQ
jgi:FlaG/FlaF family flagellin (archaellin)